MKSWDDFRKGGTVKQGCLPPPHYNNLHGFTLIEVLVSVVVLTVALVVVMELFSGGLKSGRISQEYVRAVYLAREKMEEILTAQQLAPGSEKGEFRGGYTWEVEISAIDEEPNGTPVNKTYGLFRIDLKISWLDGKKRRQYSLSTLQSARVEVLEGT